MNSVEHKNAAELAEAIALILAERQSAFVCPVDPARRMEDHEWIRLRREKEQARIKFWDEMYTHAAKWGMIAGLSFIFYALYLAAKHEMLK